MTENSVPRIFRLSDETISGIRSSKHISSLQGVVFALLENSLDAKSNKIEITVDWPRGACCVQDNGHGIPTTEFNPEGGLGRMHCTSKRHPDGEWVNVDFETHGTNGMFLAELASLSMLSITSKTIDSDEAAGVTLHNGRVIKRQIGNSLSDFSMNIASGRLHGTQVTVRDLFGNMPVRVKQRALAGFEDPKLWHEVKHGIVSLLLAWPDSCTVKLRDANSQSRMVTLASRNLSDAADLTKKNLHQLHSRSPKFDLRDALSLLFQAGYASPESRSRWIPLAASTSSITLKGLICLEPNPTKQCQFISIGIHPCTRSTTFSELYEAANQVFYNSDFGKVDFTRSLNIADDRSKSGHGSVGHRTALKGVDRFASYCIQIHFKKPWHHTSNIISSNLLTSIVHVLEMAIFSWLDKNLFRPTKRNRSTHSSASKISKDVAIAHPTNGPKQPVDCKEIKPDYEGYDDILRSHSRIRAGSSYSRSHVSHEPPNMRTTISADGQGLQTSPVTLQSSGSNAVRHAAPDSTMIEPGKASFVRSRNHIADSDVQSAASAIPTSAHKSLLNDPDAPTQSSEDYGSIEDEDFIAAASIAEASAPNETASFENQFLQWTDPISKRIYKIDSRTGTVITPESQASASPSKASKPGSDVKGILSTTTPSTGRQLRLVERVAENKKRSLEHEGETSPWLSELLQTWDNPIFKAQRESPIPTLSAAQTTSHHSGVLDSLIDTAFMTNLNNFTKSSGTQLSRTVLDALEVINQVDKKFILCQVINTPQQSSNELSDETDNVRGGALVIVDQHAASERIIVEHLLQEFYNSLCAQPDAHQPSTNGILATKGIQFDIPEAESELFTSYRGHFAVWGVRYEITHSTHTVTQNDYLNAGRREDRINVVSLPSVIAERCSNFPKLCIDMMRTEAWAIAEGAKRPVSSIFRQHDEGQSNERAGEADVPLWLKHLSSCPKGILDMINSRACRSAVMFNDALTIDECRSLMNDLRRCTFPFVCAHGRASMVPLTRLGHSVSIPSPDFLGGVEELEYPSSKSSQSLGSALSNWMRSRSHVT